MSNCRTINIMQFNGKSDEIYLSFGVAKNVHHSVPQKKHRPATRNLPFFHPCQQRGRLRRTGRQQRAEGLAVHLQQIEAVETPRNPWLPSGELT